MEKRPPPRQAFQPSRSRLLQPGQLFKSTRQTSDAQPKPESYDRSRTTPVQAPPSDPSGESKPIPRVPRLPSNHPKPVKPQTPLFAPFLSKSLTPIKQPSLPLRSANQPALSAKLPTPAASPTAKTGPAATSGPTATFPQHHASESRNSHQPTIPFPLSTVPAHVLQSMSQDSRDGFVAGWSAGWDAYEQSIRNTQDGTSTKSPVPSKVTSRGQHSRTTQQLPPRLPPVRLTPAVVPRKAQGGGGSSRRSLPDPYAIDGKSHTVGAKKRPRTAPPANATRPSEGSPNQQSSSTGQILKPSAAAAVAHSARSSQGQNGTSEPRKRMSGLDAYLARGKLGPQSVQAAFSAATTSDTVEFRRKKRKRDVAGKESEPRRPAETGARQEPRRPVEARPRKEPTRSVETRSRQDTRPQVDTRARQEPSRPVETRTRQDTRWSVDTRARQDARRPVETRTRQDPRRPVETTTRPDHRQPVETATRPGPRPPAGIRPLPQPTQVISRKVTANNTTVPSWLKNSTSSGNESVQTPVAASNTDPRQNQKTATAKNAIAIPPKTPQPTPTKKAAPVQKNSIEMRKQSFPPPAVANGSRCDLDLVRSSQECQEDEESGWGSALNAVTTRERLPTSSLKATATGKLSNAPGTEAQKPMEASTGTERDPGRKQRAERNMETEGNNNTSRISEKERDDITVQAYAERCGLVIVERNRESGKVEWVACKFCPVFGCRTRDPDYIMAHRAPFSLKKFVTHLDKDHCVKWKEYKQANAEEKGRFFSGKALPAKAFHDRVAELKRSHDGMARRRPTPGVTAEEENARIDKAMEKLAKQQVVQTVTTVVLDTTDECWIGRDRFRNQHQEKSMSVCQRQKPTGTTEKLLSLERISKCVKELEIDSNIAGFILHGIVKDSTEEEWADPDRGFTDTIVLNGDEMRPTTLIFSSIDEATSSRVALTLRYLHDGRAGSICMALLRNRSEIQASVPTSDDAGREVLGHGNALMALGMHILTRAFAADWRSWAIGLTTRSCRYVTGGVEVLISMQDDCGEMRKAHLITVQNVSGAGAAVIEVLDVILPSWKQRLLGVHSGICKQTQEYEKRIEAAILGDVRKLAGRELLLVGHDVGRDDKPIFPWALSKMSDSKFERLLSSIEGPLGIALGKARVKAAKVQRGDLFKRVMSGGEREAFREAWNVAGERAAEICVVAEGLRSVWICDCDEDEKMRTVVQRRGKGMVVDSDAERVLWVRGLVRLWKWCGKVVKELGLEIP